MRNLIKLNILICIAMNLPNFSYAVDNDNLIVQKNNLLELQLISSDVNYREIGNGMLGSRTGLLDTEKGSVLGMSITFTKMADWLWSNDFLSLNASKNKGHTNYVGSSQGGAYGSMVAKNATQLTDFSIKYGKGFFYSSDVMLTPYLELGHHEWNRSINAGEIYTNKYAGIGFLTQSSLANSWVLSVEPFIGRALSPAIKFQGANGFSTGLGADTLVRVGLSADYMYSKELHFNIGFEVQKFNYGISSIHVVGTAPTWEPDSKTEIRTLKFGVGYAF